MVFTCIHDKALLSSSPSLLCDEDWHHLTISFVDPNLHMVPWDHLLLQSRHRVLAGQSRLKWAVCYPDLDTITASACLPSCWANFPSAAAWLWLLLHGLAFKTCGTWHDWPLCQVILGKAPRMSSCVSNTAFYRKAFVYRRVASSCTGRKAPPVQWQSHLCRQGVSVRNVNAEEPQSTGCNVISSRQV